MPPTRATTSKRQTPWQQDTRLSARLSNATGMQIGGKGVLEVPRAGNAAGAGAATNHLIRTRSITVCFCRQLSYHLLMRQHKHANTYANCMSPAIDMHTLAANTHCQKTCRLSPTTHAHPDARQEIISKAGTAVATEVNYSIKPVLYKWLPANLLRLLCIAIDTSGLPCGSWRLWHVAMTRNT